jgi:hypothetical protein
MPHLVIVRRGQAGAYETLKAEFEHDSNAAGVRVMWDRRQSERRETIAEVQVEGERRRRERRRPVPTIWTRLGILVAAVEV